LLDRTLDYLIALGENAEQAFKRYIQRQRRTRETDNNLARPRDARDHWRAGYWVVWIELKKRLLRETLWREIRDHERISYAAPAQLRRHCACRRRECDIVKVQPQDEQVVWSNDLDGEIFPLTLGSCLCATEQAAE
jgi:hypothetical protein